MPGSLLPVGCCVQSCCDRGVANISETVLSALLGVDPTNGLAGPCDHSVFSFLTIALLFSTAVAPLSLCTNSAQRFQVLFLDTGVLKP